MARLRVLLADLRSGRLDPAVHTSAVCDLIDHHDGLVKAFVGFHSLGYQGSGGRARALAYVEKLQRATQRSAAKAAKAAADSAAAAPPDARRPRRPALSVATQGSAAAASWRCCAEPGAAGAGAEYVMQEAGEALPRGLVS